MSRIAALKKRFAIKAAPDLTSIRSEAHLNLMREAARATAELDPSVPVVTYCWGPGCNGATRAALALAQLGYRVREMLGGFEYWAREGLPVATAGGIHRPTADPLTAPVAVSCGC